MYSRFFKTKQTSLAYLKIRSSTSVRVAPILFNSKFREWMAIISSPLPESSPPEARERLKCSCHDRISKIRQVKTKRYMPDRLCGAYAVVKQ